MSEQTHRRRAYAEQSPMPDSCPNPQSEQFPPFHIPNQTIIVNQVASGTSYNWGDQSYFDGGLLSCIAWSLIAILLTIVTLGLAYPFAACILYKWEARHTVINGRRLCFDGNGWQLLGRWILWMILTVITLGIYSFWLVIKLKQWRIKHTHFE